MARRGRKAGTSASMTATVISFPPRGVDGRTSGASSLVVGVPAIYFSPTPPDPFSAAQTDACFRKNWRGV